MLKSPVFIADGVHIIGDVEIVTLQIFGIIQLFVQM